MASLRTSSSLARQLVTRRAATPGIALARARQSTSQQQHARYLNTSTAPVLYSAHATVVGARTGHVKGGSDSALALDLTMAKALGGPGDRGKTNPEELFAAGYGACFQSAMNASAVSLGIKMPSKKEDSVVETTVHLVGDMKKLDMGLRVDIQVKVKGPERSELEKVVKRAEEVCPYSRATKGNVQTRVEIVDFEGKKSSSANGDKGRDKKVKHDMDPENQSDTGAPKSYGTSTYG